MLTEVHTYVQTRVLTEQLALIKASLLPSVPSIISSIRSHTERMCQVSGQPSCLPTCSLMPYHCRESEISLFFYCLLYRVQGNGVLLHSIDHLPAQLPRESTDYFSSRLMPFVKELVSLFCAKS